MAFLDFLFNPIFLPLLKLPSVVAIFLISLVLTLILTFIYKRFTDQSLMKSLKDEIKSYQDDMKKNRDDPHKVLKIQKKAMDANLKYMSHSLKPTLITMIPIIFIFGWLNAHFTFEPLLKDLDFFVTAEFEEGAAGDIIIKVPEQFVLQNDALQQVKEKVEWKLRGPPGQYVLSYNYELRDLSQSIRINADRSDRLYEDPVLNKAELVNLGLPKEAKLRSITVGNKRIRPFGNSFNLFGWYPGWLATYITFSIGFSIGLRKLMKVY